MDASLRRKNLILAWVLVAFVLLMVLSSVPFWRGFVRMVAGTGAG